MEKFKGIMQLLLAFVSLLLALAAAVNLFFILQRPESISVVNALIGLSVLIVCFLAAARVLSRRALARLRSS